MSMQVGIQLYSVRNSMQEDPLGTIQKVAECGYKYLEAANHNALEDQGVGFGVSAKELKKVLDDSGAQIVSAHIYPFDEEKYKAVMEYNLEIGNKNIIYPMGNFKDKDQVLEFCETFNKLGELSRTNGLNFLYHNHSQEFMTIGGTSVMDIMMERVAPENMGLELDTFWTMRAGLDPVETIKKYGSRIKLLHQKDMSKDTTSPVNVFEKLEREVGEKGADFFTHISTCVDNKDFTEIGTGLMDIQSIINAANEIGAAQYIILEQDYTQQSDEITSIKISMEAFRKFEGIKW